MKKYGLQLRVPPSQQKKQPTRPPLPTPSGFRDDDEDDVEREIARHASRKKALKDIEEQHKKALEEDPSVFDYDGVYDEMKEKVDKPQVQDRIERKPKYIQNLIKKAEQRRQEHEIIYEKKLVKERSKDDHLYADKLKFVTSGYKKKLAGLEKFEEEERLRQLREEKDEVTKKKDLTEFYYNLGKNVAFGAQDVELRKPEKQEEKGTANTPDKGRPLTDSSSTSEPSRMKEGHQGETSTPPRRIVESLDSKPVSDNLVSDTSVQKKSSVEQPSADQQKRDHHKRTEDALAAAKERFLARKRMKEQ